MKHEVKAMKRHVYQVLIAFCLAIWIDGCANGIADAVRSQVNYTGSFSQLQLKPEAYKGRTVLLGGKIINVEVLKERTDIFVLQLELNGSEQPQNNDQSNGRFIIRTSKFIDPAIYPQGTLITVAGKVTGSEEKYIGQMPYKYTLIEPLEIKKWPPESDQSPRFHFGFGIGTTF